MQNAQQQEITLASPEATAALARRLAPLLGAGDCILLEGPIGAGKSHFSRALIKARLAVQGRDEDVPSPTFTLVQTYDDGLVEIWHADLYRLNGPADIDELGLWEAFDSAICLVEWPDRLGEYGPTNALTLRLTPNGEEDARRAVLSYADRRWQTRLAELELSDVG
ncbi:MAG TPA: tRNA (adenosine(37)-N6)-threonylcarbamoyltransferase complex ATPase subunit type 1 TsaE [Aliiroseovarius sp.]|nr:tRNA (adenosine(37)-N6)-threonylcarbamoyltransferase complex ATPase subunit type 1 TsaE [Aliiroseovarius sp.]